MAWGSSRKLVSVIQNCGDGCPGFLWLGLEEEVRGVEFEDFEIGAEVLHVAERAVAEESIAAAGDGEHGRTAVLQGVLGVDG